MAAPEIAGRRLEAYAQKCLTFSPQHFAYLSLVLGNAAIHAFSLMPGTSGVGSLSRLRRHLKRPGEIKTVDKALAALASARGMSSGELEEIGLPAYGFAADGTLDIPHRTCQREARHHRGRRAGNELVRCRTASRSAARRPP